jgi:phosphomannomutase
MEKIVFGTDGWRGIIAKDFTLANVAKVAYALARWLAGKYQQPSAIIGYDCRFGGEMFMEAIAKILASKNIRVYISENYVSSPMVSLGVLKLKANCGVMITASHNPAEYNGIKLKGQHGGPMLDSDVKDIENLISSEYEFDLEMLNWNYLLEQGLIQYINLDSIYQKNITDNFDIDRLNKSELRFAFDAMYGSAQNVFRKLMPGVKLFRCETNPSFKGIPPEPIAKNLHPLEEYIWNKKDIDAAFAVDGDGDRIAFFDEKGNYLDSHHVILLLIYCLAEFKGLGGKVVVSVPTTSRVEKLCGHFGLEVVRTAVGFKEIAGVMLKENILIGGEESGGITVGTYMPERDGVWIGITIWNILAEQKIKLSEIIKKVYAITGSFVCERLDLDINKNHRKKVLEKCLKDPFQKFGEYTVQNVIHTDGYKYELGNGRSVLIRPSGTRPILRIYVEASTRDEVISIINSVVNTINFSE